MTFTLGPDLNDERGLVKHSFEQRAVQAEYAVQRPKAKSEFGQAGGRIKANVSRGAERGEDVYIQLERQGGVQPARGQSEGFEGQKCR